MGKHFGDSQRAVIDLGDFDSGSQAIFRDWKSLFAKWVVEGGEDGGMYLGDGVFK